MNSDEKFAKFTNILNQNNFSKRLDSLEVLDKDIINEIKLTNEIIKNSKCKHIN